MRNASTEPGRSLWIVVPTFNDWDALTLLLDSLDATLNRLERSVRLLIVDDGSDTPLPETELSKARVCIEEVRILGLRRNLGHQRAIAIALAWLDANLDYEAVVVMDGDGEDAPADIPKLPEEYDHAQGKRIVFAARHRRSEGFVFQLFYRLYRVLHLLLTGVAVQVGNFSIIPRSQLHRLVIVSELWNHYAAAVFKARLPIMLVPTSRAKRLSGRPKMNFTQLVVHGVSAMSVFGDRVGVRLLLGATSMGLVILFCIGSFTLWRFYLDTPASWEVFLAVLVVIVLGLNLLLATLLFTFSILGSRDNAGFLPARDYVWFVGECRELWKRDG